MVKDQDQKYVAEEDPTVFVSDKTGRGPLDSDWIQEYSDACVVRLIETNFYKYASFCSQGQPMPTPKGQSIMCAYKLCKVEFRYWGMQSKIERFIHDMALRNTMLGAHRQVGI